MPTARHHPLDGRRVAVLPLPDPWHHRPLPRSAERERRAGRLESAPLSSTLGARNGSCYTHVVLRCMPPALLCLLLTAGCAARQLPATEMSASMLQTRADPGQLRGRAPRQPLGQRATKTPGAETARKRGGSEAERTQRPAGSDTPVNKDAQSTSSAHDGRTAVPRSAVPNGGDGTRSSGGEHGSEPASASSLRTSRRSVAVQSRGRGFVALLLSAAAAIAFAALVSRRGRTRRPFSE